MNLIRTFLLLVSIVCLAGVNSEVNNTLNINMIVNNSLRSIKQSMMKSPAKNDTNKLTKSRALSMKYSGQGSVKNDTDSNGRSITIWGLKTLCPMAFQEVGGRCYFYGHFPLNWYRAMEFCHSFGAGVSLAAIESRKENMFIKRFLKIHGDRKAGVWVGGTDNGHNGEWAWFPTGKLLRYQSWGPSQPSGGDQHCMYLVGGRLSYQWADFHCLFDMHFLCEHNVNDERPW